MLAGFAGLYNPRYVNSKSLLLNPVSIHFAVFNLHHVSTPLTNFVVFSIETAKFYCNMHHKHKNININLLVYLSIKFKVP